jgi:hypothetical protein
MLADWDHEVIRAYDAVLGDMSVPRTNRPI